MKNIHISNVEETSGLRVSWTPSQGDVDSYCVFLNGSGRVMETLPTPKHVNDITFSSLQPGEKYSIRVRSISGNLHNDTIVTARTGEPTITLTRTCAHRHTGTHNVHAHRSCGHSNTVHFSCYILV